MACSRKKFWNSRTTRQLLVSNPPLMFSSSVFLFNPVISWLDVTNFALPGYEGISFLTIFNLSLKVELGEECNGRYRGLSDEFEAFSNNSVAFSSSLSTPNKPKGLEGMTSYFHSDNGIKNPPAQSLLLTCSVSSKSSAENHDIRGIWTYQITAHLPYVISFTHGHF